MENVIAFASRPRADAGAADAAALVRAFAHDRRDPDDVFWLKENAELLNVLESTGRSDEHLLAPYEPMLSQFPDRLVFFPQYYRFFLSIALDLEDMGLDPGITAPMVAQVCRDRLYAAELSDLQRAEARRLLARRGSGDMIADPGLDDRLRAFACNTDAFAVPNRKAAYELTHILFYLSEYGRRDPALPKDAITSLRFAGQIALLEHNADLLAEICIALRFAGATPPTAWEAWVRGRLRATRVARGAKATLPDSYHDWLMGQWMQYLDGDDLFAGQWSIGAGRISFHMQPPDGPLRAISRVLLDMGQGRRAAWWRMRAGVMEALTPEARKTVEMAETDDLFEPFFARFARVAA
jgi:hypothetical protein